MITLRPYQLIVFNAIVKAVQQGFKRILVVMPCRSGKTPLAAAIVERIAPKNKRILFNVHRSVLIEQTNKLFNSLNIQHGIYSPYYPETDHKIQIGSIMTVYKRKDRLPKQDLILSDECHRDLAFTRQEIINTFSDSILIGLTATPCRNDNTPMGDIYDKMILGPTPHELIQQGFLCDFVVYAPPSLVDVSDVNIIGGDFNKIQLEKATNKKYITGDAIKHWKNHCEGLQTVVFAVSIQHAINIVDDYNNAGIPAGILHSKMSKNDLELNIALFVSREINILVNVDMVTEGFDCPGIEAVQLLRKTNSIALHIQMSTRGMTIDKNNPDKKCVILDHVGNTEELGNIDDDFNWSLDSGSGRKKSSSVKSGVKVCGKCYHVYKPYLTACPLCGYEKLKEFKPFKVIDTDLQILKSTNKKIRDLIGKNEIQGTGIDELKRRLHILIENNIPETNKEYIKLERRISLLRAKTLESLIVHANKYGYDKHWIALRYSHINRGMSQSQIYSLVNKHFNKET